MKIAWYTEHMKRSFIIFLILVFCSGCMAPRLDTSSTRKMEKSMNEMRDKLTDEQNDRLDKAMMLIAFDAFEFDNILKMNEINTNNMLSKVKRKLDGKTYNDIIGIAKNVAKKKISELKKQKKETQIAEKGISQVEVKENQLFNKTEVGAFGSTYTNRVLKLTVKNNHSMAFSKIYFNAKTFAKDRDVPYLNDDFVYEIPGGIQPGETQTWELVPNIFGDENWRKDIPGGYLVVKAINAEDANGKKVYDSEWSDSKQKELDELEDLVKD